MKKKRQFAVLGLGRFGKSAAFTLEEMGYEVLGVDMDAAVVENIGSSLSQVVSFDIRDARALDQVGISEFDTVIISSKNLEASLMATMLCKERNVQEIVVKAIDERHAEMARRLGATQVVFSERDMARRMVTHLVSPWAVDYIDIGANIGVIKMDVPSELIGKSLKETNLRAEYQVNIIAIRKGNETIVTPPPDHVFAQGDQLFLVGAQGAMAEFERNVLSGDGVW